MVRPITFFLIYAGTVCVQLLLIWLYLCQLRKKKRKLLAVAVALQQEDATLTSLVVDAERRLANRFLLYDTARKLTGIMNGEKLLEVFTEEMKYLGPIETIAIDQAQDRDAMRFTLDSECKQYLYVHSRSPEVCAYAGHFAKLLRLCFERIRLYEQLQELSIYDALTKSYNRRYFMSRLSEEFERVRSFDLTMSFLMIDVDRFKQINDTYGHLVGDAVLREVASLIRSSVREVDFLGRVGGEEFAVVLTETDKTGAIMVAERINLKVSSQPIKVFDETLSVNVSIGLAAFPQNTIHSDVLIEIADKALYQAKNSGRNRVCWF